MNSALLRPVDKEYNDLKIKSQEAEQEFKLAQSKVYGAREHLSKLQKELDGKIIYNKWAKFSIHSSIIKSFTMF